MSKFDDGKNETPPTRLIRKNETKKVEPSSGSDDKGTQRVADNRGDSDFRQEAGSMAGGNFSEADQRSAPGADAVPVADSNKTVFFRAKKAEQDVSAESSTSNRPVTAWLVVISGAGKGSALPISYGLHKIGRDLSQDVAMNFGDDGISREQHASIEYDTKLRKFFLSKGNNLVYLNGERVGQGGEKEIATGDEIQLTDDTTLRFVTFCDENFDWNES